MSLNIELLEIGPGRVQIALSGRLDTHTSAKLEARLDALDPLQYPVQILDLEQLGYLSSAGLRCIFKAKKKLPTGSAWLLLLKVQPPVKKVLDIIKALPESEIFANERELELYLAKTRPEISAGQ